MTNLAFGLLSFLEWFHVEVDRSTMMDSTFTKKTPPHVYFLVLCVCVCACVQWATRDCACVLSAALANAVIIIVMSQSLQVIVRYNMQRENGSRQLTEDILQPTSVSVHICVTVKKKKGDIVRTEQIACGIYIFFYFTDSLPYCAL